MGSAAKPDETGGSGGTSNNAGGGAGGSQREPEVRYVDANVQAIIARHGSADAAIRTLFRDAKRARDGKRSAEQERDAALEAAKVKPGTIVLAGDDAKVWTDFKAIGKTPAEISGVLKSHGELSEKVTTQERQTTVRTAARLAKFNEDALVSLVEDKKLAIVLVKEQVDGRDVEVPYVQPAGENAAKVKLAEYADKNLAVYKPALLAAGSSNGTQGAGGATGEARRTPFPEQGTSGTTQKADAAGATTPVPGVTARVLPSQRNAAATKP